MSKGKIFAFEGIDYSGKDTQLNLFASYLNSTNRNYKVFREPGGTDIGDQIRKILLDGKNTRMNEGTELLLFTASRAQLVHETKEILEEGTHIIFNRFKDSTYAYQGWGRNEGNKEYLNIVEAIHNHILEDIQIARTYYIHISIEEHLKRKQKFTGDLDRMEQNDIGFYKRVIQGYENLAKTKTTLRLNGELPPAEISAKIITDFEEVLSREDPPKAL